MPAGVRRLGKIGVQRTCLWIALYLWALSPLAMTERAWREGITCNNDVSALEQNKNLCLTL